jgi:membrane protein YqaA with SNARE-associated domain
MIHLSPIAEVALAGSAPHFWSVIGHGIYRLSNMITDFLRPFGAWGLGGLALFDSALLPLPVPMDSIIVGYVQANRSEFVLYAFAAAFFSVIGGLLPFYVGRLGGELFLLKKINRERYERLRDSFERQEFVAILVPAMGPPPTPIKLFEFAAGVFDMKLRTFLLAMFIGKFAQFLFFATLAYLYGPTILHALSRVMRDHASYLFFIVGFLLLLVIVWSIRKLICRKSEPLRL